jgi:hypothetical protein
VSQAPGWYRDPFLRDQERYWDGRLWTQGTRPVEAEGTNASAGSTNVADPTDDTGLAHQADQQATPRGAGDVGGDAPSVPAPPSVFAPLGAPIQRAVTTPSATPGSWAAPTAGTATTFGSGHRRRHRVAFGVTAAAVALIVAGLASVLSLGGGGTSGQASAAEAVVTAATQTINANSANVSMSMSASTTGMDESLSATGAFDFAQKTGTMTMTIPADGQQYSEQEIIDGSTIYVNVSGLNSGLNSSLDASKPWVSVPVDQADSSPTDISTLDATALLHQLQSVGGSVTSLGQTGYDGTPVTEYQTTLPASALEASMGALPSSSGQNTSGLDFPDMTIDVYVTQDNLLKALVVPTYSFDIVGETVSVQMTLTFSNYGTAVNVTPPPADQVQPLPVCGCEDNSGSTGNSGNTGDFGNTGSTT